MIETIIFDIGNVLAGFYWQPVYEKYFKGEDLELATKLTIGDLDSWNVIDQGVKTFDDYIDLVGEKAPHLKEKIHDAIIEIFKTIVPFDYAENWVKEMKERGYKVYILSNYGDVPFNLSKERFTFLNHVHGALISYEVKLIKPHKEIFETLFKKFDINPETAVFIDDNANNIVGANKVGLKTVHFTEYEKGKKELEEILSKVK